MSKKATGEKHSSGAFGEEAVEGEIKRPRLEEGEGKASSSEESSEVTQPTIVPAPAPQIRPTISKEPPPAASSSNETNDVGRVTTVGDTSSREPDAVRFESELAETRKKLAGIEQEKTELMQERKELKQERNEHQEELKQEMMKKVQAESEAESESKQARIQDANQQIDRLDKKIQTLDTRIGKLDDRIALLESRINFYEESITNLTKPALQPANPSPMAVPVAINPAVHNFDNLYKIVFSKCNLKSLCFNFHDAITDRSLQAPSEFLSIDKILLLAGKLFTDQRVQGGSQSGDKHAQISIALFGSPGTSKSTSLTVLARLFEFIAYRKQALLNELQILQASTDHSQQTTEIKANSKTRSQAEAEALEAKENELRIMEIEQLLKEYNEMMNTPFRDQATNAALPNSTLQSIADCSKMLSLCITFNSGMPYRADLGNMNFQLNSRVLFIFFRHFPEFNLHFDGFCNCIQDFKPLLSLMSLADVIEFVTRVAEKFSGDKKVFLFLGVDEVLKIDDKKDREELFSQLGLCLNEFDPRQFQAMTSSLDASVTRNLSMTASGRPIKFIPLPAFSHKDSLEFMRALNPKSMTFTEGFAVEHPYKDTTPISEHNAHARWSLALRAVAFSCGHPRTLKYIRSNLQESNWSKESDIWKELLSSGETAGLILRHEFISTKLLDVVLNCDPVTLEAECLPGIEFGKLAESGALLCNRIDRNYVIPKMSVLLLITLAEAIRVGDRKLATPHHKAIATLILQVCNPQLLAQPPGRAFEVVSARIALIRMMTLKTACDSDSIFDRSTQKVLSSQYQRINFKPLRFEDIQTGDNSNLVIILNNNNSLSSYVKKGKLSVLMFPPENNNAGYDLKIVDWRNLGKVVEFNIECRFSHCDARTTESAKAIKSKLQQEDKLRAKLDDIYGKKIKRQEYKIFFLWRQVTSNPLDENASGSVQIITREALELLCPNLTDIIEFVSARPQEQSMLPFTSRQYGASNIRSRQNADVPQAEASSSN